MTAYRSFDIFYSGEEVAQAMSSTTCLNEKG